MYPGRCNAPDVPSSGGLDPRIPPAVRNVEVKSGKGIKPWHLGVAGMSLATGLIIGTWIRPMLSSGMQLIVFLLLLMLAFGVVVIDRYVRRRE